MMSLLKTNDTKLLRRRGAQTSLWVLLAALILLMAGCVQPSATGQEPTSTSITPPAGPVIAVAPLNGLPGTSISVASAGWQPKEVIYINLESTQAGKTVASTVGVATADNDGRVTVSFILPPDVALSDSPDITVVAYSSTTGERTSTPFTVGETAATATITGTLVSTLTQTATATSTPVPATPTSSQATVAAPTATPTNLGHVLLDGLNLRAGPGTNYLIVANLGLGTELSVIGQSANGYWLNVRLPGGGEGWLARPYTDFKGAAPVVGPPPAPTYAPGATATPTPLYTSTPVNTPATINNWRGEYFNNRSLISNPVLVRDDTSVDFDWGTGAPATNLPVDNFAVRWTRGQYFDAGTYRFHLLVDDGAYLFVDDNLLINEWHDGSVRETTADLYLGQGTHNLRVEYYENTGDARIKVWWERIDSSSSDSYPDWKGEYWSNRRLDGDPELTRNDGDINFNWGNDSPDDRIPDDNFSVRWTRSVDFRSGLYRLTARADDGIRVWVDGDRVIDEWHDNNYDNEYTIELNLDGDTDLRVEYYEHNGGARVRFRWDRIGSEGTATPTNPNTDVNPTSGTAGSHVFVTGGGFPANTAVHVYLGAEVRASSASAAPQRYADGTTDNRGFYRIEFNLPTTWPDGKPIEPGQLVVLVATDNFTVQASDIFQVLAPKPTVSSQPYANVEPGRGGANTPVTIYGGGFPANTRVGVYLAEVAAANLSSSGPKRYVSTTTDANGNYSMRWTIPNEWDNGETIQDGKLVIVVATDSFSVQASATFDYFTSVPNPSIRLAPTSGGAGTQVTVNGGGFPANIPVYARLGVFGEQIGTDNAQLYASTTTDRNGNYSMSFAMPAAWSNGSPITADKLIILVGTQDYSIAVSAVFNYTPSATPVGTATATPIATPVAPVQNPSASLAPGTGGANTLVTVTGGGFPTNVTVNVYLAGFDGDVNRFGTPERYTTGNTDASGNYRLVFTMPEDWPNGDSIDSGRILVIVATNDFTTQASAVFTYRESSAANLDATSVATGTATSVADTPTAEPTATPAIDTATAATATATAADDTSTVAPTATATPEPAEPTVDEPTATSTNTSATDTPTAAATDVPPTESVATPTEAPATATSAALADTPTPTLTDTPVSVQAELATAVPTKKPARVRPTAPRTPKPPTATVMPTVTPAPPTDTPVPPTATSAPPTATPVPPTDVPAPPTDTPLPPPSAPITDTTPLTQTASTQ